MIKIGQVLANEREKKGLSVEQVAAATKIKEPFLVAIESGNFRNLPSSAYAFGFVRNYARFLNLPEEKTLALFKREYDAKTHTAVLPRSYVRDNEFSSPRMRVQLAFIAGFFVFVLLLGFLIFQYKGALFAPGVNLSSPQEQSSIKSQTVTVAGSTDSDATVVINDQPVTVDDNGKFTKTLPVFSGKTTIVVKVTNRFGKTTVIQRHITVMQ